MVTGVCSHVPGGLGVLELVILAFMPAEAKSASSPGCWHSAIYYLMPLLVGMVVLVANEILLTGVARHKAWGEIGRWVNSVCRSFWPARLSPAALCCLQRSYAAPFRPAGGPGRSGATGSGGNGSLHRQHCWDYAHSRRDGLQKRLDAAWWLAVSLLGLGIVASLLKGLDFEEAGLLSVVLIGLLASRRRFYRQGSLVHERFTPGWLATIGLAVMCSIWLGLFTSMCRIRPICGGKWRSTAMHPLPAGERGGCRSATVIRHRPADLAAQACPDGRHSRRARPRRCNRCRDECHLAELGRAGR